ncbi:hypothetical protein AYO47_02085 [Planctomyces sp. SCGC AG-212-M04]|nr:hypothetical protein AYO47_02085 [Planctomyces sp. SCGC AG-212-M04]
MEVQVPWGLRSVVHRLAGRPCRIQYEGCWNPASWVPLATEELALHLRYPPDPELSRLVQEYPNGVIRALSEASRLDAAAQIIEAYPDRRIAILAETLAEVKVIRKGLRTRLGEQARSRVTRPDLSPGLLGGSKVYVGLFGDLNQLQNSDPSQETGLRPTGTREQPRRIELVLIWKAKAAALSQYEEVLLSEPHAKMFGFMLWDAQYTPGEQLAVQSMFGFHSVLVGEQGQCPRPVTVSRLEIGTAGLPVGLSKVEVLNAGIRHNDARNWQLLRAAKIYASEGLSTLLVAADVLHAIQLAGRLPGWSLLSKTDGYRDAFQAASGRSALKPCPAHVPNAIVLEDELHQINLGNYFALVHAGIHALAQKCVESILFPGNKNQTEPFHLLDCRDAHHKHLTRLSKERRKQYTELGWSVDGSDPLEERVKAFIRAQWRRE